MTNQTNRVPTGSSFEALRQLLVYATAFRRRILLASLCSFINKVLDVMPELLIGVAIDVVIRQQDSFLASLGVRDPFHQLLILGFATLLVWAGESLFEYLFLVLWRNLAQDLQHHLRLDAYHHVQHLDLQYYDQSSTGNLVSILNDDVNQLERFFNGGANSLIQILTAVVIVGAIFFILSPTIALIAFSPIPIIILGAFFFQRRAQPLYADVREKVGDLSARLEANLAGIQTIKSFTTEAFEHANLSRDSKRYVEANRRAIRVSSAFIPIIRMAILAGFLATLLLGGWMAIQGDLQVGSYGALVFLTQRLLWPLTGLAEVVDLFERAMASSNRILSLIRADSPIRDRANAVNLNQPSGAVQFSGVHFSYRDDLPVLQNLTLSIPAGSTAAFVGATGSGKSTLVKLLLRFYQPDQGHIQIDDIPLNDIKLNSLRGHIGLVAQDSYLFPGSIAQNVAYGEAEPDEQRLADAARTAGATEFIERFPEGLATRVGERGQRLSGGQRQRLAIARALYKDAPILILDEATSAVDNETEAAIQRALQAVSKNRTTLIVAHRLSTIVHADCIYVMDRGKIVDTGTHEELINRPGIYQSLWQVQTGLPLY
ncbi:MAG: ABC transporter ATP-binding protein [Pseudomonadota bacterium]